MQLFSVDSSIAFDFALTPSGWSLLAFNYGHAPREGLRHLDIVARRREEQGQALAQPLFAIDFLRNGLLSIVVTPAGVAMGYADADKNALNALIGELDSLYNLNMGVTLQEVTCNFVIGSHGRHSLSNVLASPVSI